MEQHEKYSKLFLRIIMKKNKTKAELIEDNQKLREEIEKLNKRINYLLRANLWAEVRPRGLGCWN